MSGVILFQLIGVPFADPDHGMQMYFNYTNIDVDESTYIYENRGKANNLKMDILSQALKIARSGLLEITKSFEVNIFTPEYNANRRAQSQPIVAFLMTKVTLNINIFLNMTEFCTYNNDQEFNESYVQKVALIHNRMLPKTFLSPS